MVFAIVIQDDDATFCALVASFNVVNQHFAFDGGDSRIFLIHRCQPAGDALGVGSC